jgi:ABC-2 type transport system permease protein
VLRSVYLKSLRDMRWGVLGWGGGLGVFAVVFAYAWSFAYPDAASRAQLAAQIHGGLSVAQAVWGPATEVDHLGGFIEWRLLGFAPMLLGLYFILSATGLTRGAEESRTIEVVAATPRGRTRLMLEQAAALGTAALVTTSLMAVLTAAAPVVASEPSLGLRRIALTYANLTAASLLFAGLGLLTAQFFSRRRSAALAATGLMAGAYLLNTVPLAVPGLHELRYFSPLRLYTESTPLANGQMNWLALASMIAVATVLGAVALYAAGRRDLFDTVHGQRATAIAEPAVASNLGSRPRSTLFLRSALGRGLRDSFGAILAWSAGLGGLAVLLTSLAPRMRQALLEQSGGPLFKQLERAGLLSERGILSALLFSFLPPLLAAFAVTLAAGWAADELNQRLELELSAPVARWRVFVQRLMASGLALSAVAAVVAVVIGTTVEVAGEDIPLTAIGGAMWTLAVLVIAVAALSFAVASWRPAAVTAVAGTFLAASYLAQLVIPLFDLPSWASYTTIFGLYGSPLADGVTYWRVGVLAGAALALAAAGASRFQARDIAK